MVIDPKVTTPSSGHGHGSTTSRSFWRAIRIATFGLVTSPTVLTLASFVALRVYVLEARYIPSGSMLPALQLQDRLLVEKLTYRTRLPRRGEVVVFHSPYRFSAMGRQLSDPFWGQCVLGALPGLAGTFQHPKCDAYIKRVVALPGERVVVDPQGRVRINGEPLPEPYIERSCDDPQQPCRPFQAQVPDGHVLVLGDNRPNSQDGRFWGFLPVNEIIGRAWWRFWPMHGFGPLT